MNPSSLQPPALSVSRLLRNLPLVNSLAMSPFLAVGCTGCLFPIVLREASYRSSSSVTRTPLTRPSPERSFLFVVVSDHETKTYNNHTCILGLNITFSFPTAAYAMFTSNLGTHGTSGMIIDNISGLSGEVHEFKQVYFNN